MVILNNLTYNYLKILDKMNLDIKIGQMLLLGFRGLSVDDNSPIVCDIRKYHIGGVILFDYDIAQEKPLRNIQSPEQVKNLVSDLQSYADIPLIISIDYEGGEINRLPEKYGFPSTVSHQYLGEKNNLALTRYHALQMAETLSQLGITLNYVPVVDVNTNPNNPVIAQKQRSFSTDPEIVTQHALEFIKAHRQHNIACTLKHFPGHGSSRADSHFGVTDVTNTWSHKELIPYKNIIQAGEADAIMTGHVFNRQLDPDYPATLSQSTMTGLLRNELNFKGIIFSDDIQMKAIADSFGLETTVQKAIEAGVDIIMVCNNLDIFDDTIAQRVIAIIKSLVQKGVISEARIDKSYQRIQQFKSLSTK